ncbi:MAG: WecB/TagA/CpsF family glycosyltransferase [Phycisphaerales bacterium]|nr:WecB/TagA/CpsF family glycosyltransferase [Phycisphaerales bacterium]
MTPLPIGTSPIHLFDTPVHPLRMADVLALADEAIVSRRRLMIAVVNAAKLVNMRGDALLRDSVHTSDVTLADGMAVVWASKLLGRALPDRVTGIDLMNELLARADARGYRVFLLGATQEVLDEVCRHVAREHPGAKIVGAHHGYFGPSDEAALADCIAAAKPDILFVAMSPPKKEIFLGTWGPRLSVPVCHGVGGAFDVVAGRVRRAPGWMQRWGLEWFYRVMQEPGRLWRRYLVTNSIFLWMVLREYLRPARNASRAKC